MTLVRISPPIRHLARPLCPSPFASTVASPFEVQLPCLARMDSCETTAPDHTPGVE
jgi:hypothetical protein